MKKKIISFLQLCLGIGVIIYLIHIMEDKEGLLEAIRGFSENWGYLFGSLICSLLCIILCSLRWKTLMDAHDLNLSFRRTIVLYFVGHFFNAFMPGAVGGDVIKAWYVAKETHHKKTEVVSTVFIDRIIGLLGLVTLCTGIMLIRLKFFLAHEGTRNLMIFNIILLLGSAGGLFIVFQKNLMEHWSFFRKLEEKTALGKIISKIYNSFRECVKSPVVFFKAMTFSILNHAVLVVGAFFLGQGLKIKISMLDYFTVIPPINAIAAIPMTPGGLGTREMAAKYFLGILEVHETQAVLLSLLMYATMMFWSLIGGIVYILYSIHAGKASIAEISEEDPE